MSGFKKNEARAPARRDHYREVTDRIVAALEQGVAPWRRPWDPEKSVGPLSPINATTGRRYRGINVLLLGMSQFSFASGDPRFCSYKQAKDRGWQVRAGEKGTTIYFYKQLQVEDRDAPSDGEEHTRNIPLLRSFTVFNGSQIDGIPEFVAPTSEEAPWRRFDAAETILRNSGAVVRVGGDRAFYSPTTDHIQLPPERAFRSPVAYAAVQMHELCHYAEVRIMPRRLNEVLQPHGSVAIPSGIIHHHAHLVTCGYVARAPAFGGAHSSPSLQPTKRMNMAKTRKQTSVAAADWLEPHRTRFLKSLTDQGYATATTWTYDAAAKALCQEVYRRKLREGLPVGRTLSNAREAALATISPQKQGYMRFCMERFINALVEAGVAERPRPKKQATTPLDRLQCDYESYLRDQRGLTEATIYQCSNYLKRFINFRFGDTLGNLDDITSRDVVDFICKIRGGTAPRDKTPPSHLRNLFRYLFWSGKIKRDLAASIPLVRQPARSTLPRYLKPEQIDKLLDATWFPTTVGRRNYAMLMILARLGLRAPEVIAIQLDDIDWRSGTILIRGKGKRHDRMPLPVDVGKAIVDYIEHGRRGTSRTLFVSNTPPHKPFVDAQILNVVLKQAFTATGLKPPQKYVGSHLLRHSLATEMLRKGASLNEIGDVLRHRSRMSTTIYARHDINALRSIAQAWPKEKAGSRGGTETRA